MPPELPITSLLSQVLIALTIEADNEFEHRMPHWTTNFKTSPRRGVWLTSYYFWANLLRFVPDAGIRMEELAAAAGYGPPVHPMYEGAHSWGYVFYTPALPTSSPKKSAADAIVRLTPHGAQARDAWLVVIDDVHARWSERGLDSLQAALIPVVEQADRPMPEYMPRVYFDRWQPALVQPVSRAPIDLDLLGLLSQALLAMTYDFEAKSDLPLATYGGLMEALSEDAVLVRDLPELTGIAAKEWSSAAGQLAKAGLATLVDKPKTLALTPKAMAAKKAADKTLRSVEQAWQKKCGPSLDHLRRELEAVVGDAWNWTDPYPDGWRANVKLSQRLAHFPIVSHRGGYPDGS